MKFRTPRRLPVSFVHSAKLMLVVVTAMMLTVGDFARTATAKVEEKRTAAEAATEQRMGDIVMYLSSDELEGRGLETQGIEKAAKYVAEKLAEAGLDVKTYGDEPFQKLTVTTSIKEGEAKDNQLTLEYAGKEGKGAEKLPLKLGKDFATLGIGGSAKFDLPVAFAGYGISLKDAEYDDYAGIDVKDKLVILIRKHPQQNNPHSKIGGEAGLQQAAFSRKVSNAYEHGAKGVIFVNDGRDITRRADAERRTWQEAVDKLGTINAKFKEIKKPSDEEIAKHLAEVDKLADKIKATSKTISAGFDFVLGFKEAGMESSRKDFPVFFCTRAAIDKVLKQADGGKDLATLEKEIDDSSKPQSFELKGWKAIGQTSVIRKQGEIKNIVAVLPGEGDLADETVVIGSHYDHLGRGEVGTFLRNNKEIHNGADDNASGVASLLEVAYRLGKEVAEQKAKGEKPAPRRRLVFIAFSGEERGLWGSTHYVNNPKFPLDKTVAMVNMDMVGRLKDGKLIVYGTGTAKEFDKMIEDTNKTHEFKLTKIPDGMGPSDHAAFYGKKVPAIHFFTGTHSDYHRPTDDFEKINVVGMRQVTDMVIDFTKQLLVMPQRPAYKDVPRAPSQAKSGARPYFGSMPDFATEKPGYALAGVSKDSPAEKGGLKGGDLIIQLGPSKIGNLEDFDNALRKFKAGDTVPVKVTRDGKEVTFDVTLDPPR